MDSVEIIKRSWCSCMGSQSHLVYLYVLLCVCIDILEVLSKIIYCYIINQESSFHVNEIIVILKGHINYI